jgi:hypothetical protein
MRATLLLLLILSIFFTAGNIVSRQQAALHGVQAAHLPVEIAARRIANYAEDNLPSCFHTIDGQEAALTRAIIAVEYVSISRVEHVVEYVVAQIAQLTGMPLPDLSYGVAQVRPSTLAKLRSISGDTSPEASDFVNDCTSIALGHEVIESLLAKYRHVTPPKARRLMVIRDYTGQSQHRPEHIVHNAIIAHLYAQY